MFATPAQADAKVALVIGNAQYENADDLATPLDDSAAVAAHFARHGYDTVLLQNVTKAQLLVALAKLRIRSTNAEQVVIYFAGHGFQQGREHYLLNVDATFSGPRRAASLVPLRVLVRAISDRARQKILFVDTCRDNPSIFVKAADDPIVTSGQTPAGLFVLYASQLGAAAYDGIGQHSPFAQAFLSRVEDDVEIEQLARRIRVDVIRATQGLQIPWSESSLMRPAFLR